METRKTVAILVLALGLMVCQAEVSEAGPMGTAFTYQGHLYDANYPANNIYDLQFKLHNALVGGSQVGSDVNTPDVDVIDGYLTVELDFGTDVFDGNTVWLEIAVRPGDSNDRYATLSPRQEVTPTPYALYAETAASYTEVDPIFTASSASAIQGTDITNWNTAYGWGDHSVAGYLTSLPGSVMFEGENVSLLNNDVGYLTSYAETDPVYSGAPASGITSGNITNWNTAYGWGNHSTAGYLSTSNDYGRPGVSSTLYEGITPLSSKYLGISSMAVNSNMVDGYHYSSAWPTTLGNIRNGCSNDFHNIGGTDDDVPDSDGEVPDSISINNGRLYAPSGSGSVGIGTTSTPSKLTVQSTVRTIDSSGDILCWLTSTGSGAGWAGTYGPNGNVNAAFTSVSGYSDNGGVGVYNSSGSERGRMIVGSGGTGYIEIRGANGNPNFRVTYLSGYPNNGYVSVQDSSGNTQAGMYVNSSGQGIVYGDTKSFRTANPSQPGTEIWYTCPEGPEAAAYVRGTARLTNGRAEITLPDHFAAVASTQGITVQVTPLSGESKGLAVVEKVPDHFVVQELAGGNGTYDFDYTVMAVRKGYEDYRVIRSASQAEAAEANPSEAEGH